MVHLKTAAISNKNFEWLSIKVMLDQGLMSTVINWYAVSVSVRKETNR